MDVSITKLKMMIEAGHDYNRCESIVHRILMHGNREIVREALPPILHLYANSPPIGEDLLEPLFYLCMNQTPDILEELRGFNFDVNAYCNYKRTMLHCAAQVGNPSTVKFLLDRGADVDSLDREGSTPLRRSIILFILYSNMHFDDDTILSLKSCVEILLDHGADPHVLKQGASLSPVRNARREDRRKIGMLFEPILADLALLEVSGKNVEPLMRSEIRAYPRFEKMFSRNKLHLRISQNVSIDNEVTLIDLFSKNDNEIPRYALNKRLVSNASDAMKSFSSNSYCHHKLRQRLLKLSELVKLRDKVALTLNEILEKICHISVHIIAERIVSYVPDEDLYKMI